ncbi:two-component regulator propeller domain-containing protein [Pedobacter agri]|uniref:hybrid sensor histidine kinase/response regulator transcription factor n=1 Tax=Pedobacter agri TaxID=454586 RepID=UPI002931C50F|nr:two-component regulator propeller domain-containing protein [Pedobacter agri]
MLLQKLSIIQKANWLRFRWLNAIFVLCFIVITGDSEAQVSDRNFRNISVSKGLSQSTVFSIKQDTLGFIWMATQDGLNRYDSKGFKVYRPVKAHPNSLQSYYIRTLFVDHVGNLWIGGNQGVSRYDYAKDEFINYKLPRSLGEWYISSITEDEHHNLWATSVVGGIFQLSPKSKTFEEVNLNLFDYGIRKIAYIGNWKKDLLIGTDVGLFKRSGNKSQLSKIDLGSEKAAINEVYLDGDLLWVATEGAGLIRYNPETNQKKTFLHQADANSIADNNIRSVGKDTQGDIWLGTFKGLSILSAASGLFDNYFHQVSQPYTISQNSVRCFFRDKQDGIWLGTFYGGVNYYHRNDIKFNLLSQNTGKLSLNDEVVSAISQDKKGNFWIGTNDKGLNYWDRKNNTISYYTSSERSASTLASNNIKAIAFDDREQVLIGTHNGGLNILNPATGSVKRFLHDENDPNSISGNLVYSVLKDYKGRIWVGTRSGLDQFDSDKGLFSHVHLDKAGKRLSSDDITYLFEDNRRRIWIGTTNGVTLLYPDNMLFGNTAKSQISDDVITCITEDSNQRIWVGSREGLSLFDESSQTFITHRNRKDFITGTIYGIESDQEGNLWISTNKGLVCYNPATKSVQTFDESDGLQNNQFNDYAFCKARDGMLLYGGINGVSYFYPSNIKQQSLPLKVSFTALEVFGRMVNMGDETEILENPLDQTNKIWIASEYKQFTIRFNAFNYISANRTHYLYMLDGVDENWQRTDDLKVVYNNLKAGNYHFKIKAVGPNGETSAVRSLQINVLPPWYNTWWFYTLVFAFAIVGAYVAYRIIAERVRALHQLKLERVDKEKVRYINQMKMDFFTNVSHELRTPLTLILAPLEEMINKPLAQKAITKRHEMMLTNAKRLYNLVDQLFEFRKTETGTRRLKVERGDIVSFIHEIYESFKPLSDQKNIKYTYRSTQAKLAFFFDHDAMEKILFNLLSNAFKYTRNQDQISLDLSISKDYAIIKISDTGVGIGKDDLAKIFDRFYQVNNQEMNLGSGVGLAFTKRLVELHHGFITAESEIGKGSVFTVSIPTSDTTYGDIDKKDSKIYELSTVSEALTSQADQNVEEVLEDSNVVEADGMHKSHLLLVDDNQEILDYLREYFESDYLVTVAFDGLMALKILEEQAFDLIVSDVMMPELDGLHFCRRVKQNINTSHIPLMLLTAKSEIDQQIKGLEMGADDYITKPFSIEMLAAKISNLLKARKRLIDYYSGNREVVPQNLAFNTLDEEFLKKAIDVVEKHLSDSDFSVEKFSQEIGMSRSNLYLKFKAITGESATDFVKTIRFKKAVELMQSKRYTMAQVTYMCGFNSPSYFSTAFKQYYGCMPTEYLIKLDSEKG